MCALVKPRRAGKKAFFFITAIILTVSLICFIINFSVSQSIDWSLFPFGALVVVWATIAPLFMMKNNKLLSLFAGLSLTLIAFLFLIEQLVEVKGWFIPLALPIAGLCLAAFGISLIAFAYFKSNRFYPVALTIFVFGVVVNFGVGIIVSNFLSEQNVNDPSRVQTISGSIILSVVLVIAGFIKGHKVKPGTA